MASKKKAAKKAKATNGSKRTASKLGVVNVKMTSATRKKIQEKANKGTKGNFSAWLREAGVYYTRPRSATPQPRLTPRKAA